MRSACSVLEDRARRASTFGTLLGVVGAIIAVPIVASIQIVVTELTAHRREEMAKLRAGPGKAAQASTT